MLSSSHRYTIIGLKFILICSLFACSKNSTKSTFFRYNQPSNITSLDPAFARDEANNWVIKHLYNTLVELDSSLQCVPSIAKSWHIDSTKTIYTFNIRSDIWFHKNKQLPNRKLIASDIVYSLNRIIDPQLASPGAWIFNQKLAPIAFSAPDDTTFVIYLKAPYQPLLGLLTMPYCSIVLPEAVSFYGSKFRENPVGTGPFVFHVWNDNEVMLLPKNTTYFEVDDEGIQLPYVDGVRISFIENKASEFIAFKQQKIDLLNALDASYKDILLNQKGELNNEFIGTCRLEKNQYLATEYLGCLIDDTASKSDKLYLLNKNIRIAISLAINRHELVSFFRNNVGVSGVKGIVPYGFKSFETNPADTLKYDLQLAKTYVAKSGYKGERIILQTNQTFSEIGSYIVKQLEKIGLNARIEIVKGAFLKENMAKGNSAFFRASWISDYADEESFFSMFYSKNTAPPNYTRFSNTLFDKQFESYLLQLDEKSKQDLAHQLDAILMAEMPVIPLFYYQSVRFLNNRIQHIEHNALNQLNLKTVRLCN